MAQNREILDWPAEARCAHFSEVPSASTRVAWRTPMKITWDRDRYDELQAALVGRIAAAVGGHLRLLLEGRVPPELGEITNDIVFSVTSILDGSDKESAEPGVPMLTFATSEARDELIIADPGEGSWLHEYVRG